MDQDVRALKAELALLKLQFSERVAVVEARLEAVLAKEEQKKIQSSEIATNETKKAEVVPESETKSVDPNPWLHGPEASTSKQSNSRAAMSDSSAHVSNPAVEKQPTLLSAFLSSILTMLLAWLSPAIEIYKSYKDQGTLTTFVLTLVGVGLTLSGFGYLMQLLIEQMGAGAKSLLLCGVAVVVSGLGIGLKIRTRLDDFATAIVTLGVLLSYSTVYFSGSVYGILPDAILVFLYLAIALLCHALGNWLDTKVVAGLGIVGIATMPIASNSLLVDPFYYLLSLAFVSASSLVLAYKRNEHWLANLSLVFCLVSLEWVVAVEYVQVSAWLINVFYLQFFAYIAMSLVRSKKGEKPQLVLLAALVGSTILLFFQAIEVFTHSVSIVFAFNSVVAALVSIFFYKIRHTLTHLMILLASLWCLLAIVSAISNTYWGIAWAVEGLLLLYIGRRYAMRLVVNQGQALTAIALLYAWIGFLSYFPLPALASIDGWVLAAVIVAAIAIWQRLIDTSDRFDEFTQTKVKPILQLLEMIWATSLLVASLDIVIGNWASVPVILLQVLLLFRAKQIGRTSIEVFAAALIVVPLYYTYQGAILVDSFRFMALPLFAKLALVSAFIQLWLWSEFYQRYHPQSVLVHFATQSRLLFYLLLPVIWVGSAMRRLDGDILIALWASPLIAFLLASKLKHASLIKETQILTVLASISLVALLWQMDLLFGLVALAGYILYFVLAFMFERKYQSTEMSRFVMSSGLIALALAAPAFVGVQAKSLLVGAIVATLIWITYLLLLDKFVSLRRIGKVIYIVNTLLIVSGWGLMFSNEWFILMPVIFLVAAVSNKKIWLEGAQTNALLGKNYDLLLHAIGVISYVIFLAISKMGPLELLIGPLLAVHGAIILFMKERRLLTVRFSFGLMGLGIAKLALVDASNAELWQKVILFMGVGVLILLASFWYQKLVQKPQEELQELQDSAV